jgi:superoxide dismutase
VWQIAAPALASPTTLPPLPYSADALEPYIDVKTMETHHDKHHQAYVTNLSNALEKAPGLVGKSLAELQTAIGTGAVPSEVANVVRNNGCDLLLSSSITFRCVENGESR